MGVDKASGIWTVARRDELLFAWRDLELRWISSIIVFQELQNRNDHSSEDVVLHTPDRRSVLSTYSSLNIPNVR